MPVFFLPSRYKDRTHSRTWGIAKTGQISKQGTVTQTEHWNGSMDATVRPAAFGIGLHPMRPQSADSVAAVLELEAAIRENETALRSSDQGWRQRTARRVEVAKRRLAETG